MHNLCFVSTAFLGGILAQNSKDSTNLHTLYVILSIIFVKLLCERVFIYLTRIRFKRHFCYVLSIDCKG